MTDTSSGYMQAEVEALVDSIMPGVRATLVEGMQSLLAKAYADGRAQGYGDMKEDITDALQGIGIAIESLEQSPHDKLMALTIEDLDLTERPRNCLKRVIESGTVAGILKYNEDNRERGGLNTITNFGQRSYDEVVAKLELLGVEMPMYNRQGEVVPTKESQDRI